MLRARFVIIVLAISLTSLMTAIFAAQGRTVSIVVTLLGHAELAFIGYRFYERQQHIKEGQSPGGQQ